MTMLHLENELMVASFVKANICGEMSCALFPPNFPAWFLGLEKPVFEKNEEINRNSLIRVKLQSYTKKQLSSL
jgi:hypothetical protein